jgi:hypothetical protein
VSQPVRNCAFRGQLVRCAASLVVCCFVVCGSSGGTLAQTGDTCTGVIDISTMTPDMNTVGSIDQVTLKLGTLSIVGGTKLTVASVFFNPDCRNKGCIGDFNRNCNDNSDCVGFGNLCLTFSSPMCVDDGNVMGYQGNISTTCKTCAGGANSGFACEEMADCPGSDCTGSAISWTAQFRCEGGSNAGTTCTKGGGQCMGGGTCNLNKVVFTASPAFIMPAGNSDVCSLSFDIKKLALSGDTTPLVVEHVAGFTGTCDNSAPGAAPNISGSLPISAPPPTPTPECVGVTGVLQELPRK